MTFREILTKVQGVKTRDTSHAADTLFLLPIDSTPASFIQPHQFDDPPAQSRPRRGHRKNYGVIAAAAGAAGG
ncbi:hypothetical protein I316_04896 [Kwoniella heveanensis BCC8398]|uniref:Uncharacterized protein n=1 Tax=Kwoniella heveanensis BCC8398 TaxID=1296120 RepID=A0A1B9GRK4_9TREE|nr:hypothetical protein I316_04896 [Kwoniella heveanensis BCC8398]